MTCIMAGIFDSTGNAHKPAARAFIRESLQAQGRA